MHPLEVCVLPIHVVHRDMQFTEIGFAIFFVAVFALYWFVLRRRTAAQNVLLLAASYLFYGWWDWRFLGLIMLTTATTYGSAFLARKPYGKAAVTANIALNLGILALFKYLGFFTENLQRLIAAFGWNIGWFTVDVLLPVGISFYTFQAIAYSVDVYKGRVEACRDPLAFATFIAYFPQLVAGPIERASSLLPQIERPRRWDYAQAVDGCRMVLFGIMKKVCVADMLAIYVDRLYADISSPAVCVAAGLLFTMEIYFDFSAYSEIARGTSRMLGIELMANFRFPYFSRNVAEFWQRWHISLMNWFRDYLYIPLGGNRKGRRRTILNTMTIFALSGLWHGAAWNFIVWGIYWGVVYVVAKQVFGQRMSKAPIQYLSLPGHDGDFGFCNIRFLPVPLRHRHPDVDRVQVSVGVCLDLRRAGRCGHCVCQGREAVAGAPGGQVCDTWPVCLVRSRSLGSEHGIVDRGAEIVVDGPDAACRDHRVAVPQLRPSHGHGASAAVDAPGAVLGMSCMYRSERTYRDEFHLFPILTLWHCDAPPLISC